MKQQRIDYIDFAKGIGIILVLLGHTYFLPVYPQGFIYSFHMPMFFVLSGLVFSTKKPFGEFVNKKAKTLLIPYISVVPIYVAFFTLKDYLQNKEFTLFKNLVGIFFQNKGYVYAMWFFVVLFVTEVLFYGIVRLTKDKTPVIVFISALIAVCGVVYFKTLNYFLVWELQILFVSVPFFAIGYLFKKYDVLEKINKIWVIIVLYVFSLALFAVKCYYFEIYTSLTSNTYGNFAVFWALSVSATVFFLLVSKRINYAKPINYLGRNTVVLFSLQQVLVSKPLSYLLKHLYSFEQLHSVPEWKELLLSLAEFVVTLGILLAVNQIVNRTPLRVLIGKPKEK